MHSPFSKYWLYKMRKILAVAVILSSQGLQADEECECEETGGCRAKIDLAPVYVHLDILESGRTVKKHDMGGVRGDFNFRIWKGLYLKPNFIAAHGSGQGELYAGGIGIGHCFPITEQWMLTPSVGYNFTDIRTTTDIPTPIGVLKDVKEKFRSTAPYLTLEITYTFCKGWRANASCQYSWSRTHAIIKHVGDGHSKAKGPSWGIGLERDLNDDWSLNVGYGYNTSLSKEKHGIRGYGVKFAVVRWF